MTVPDPERSRVLLIGFSAFADFPPVPAVPNNLRRLKEIFRDERIWGIRGRNVVTLTGRHGMSRGGLLRRIHDEADRAEDTLVVYYAGHGFLDEDDDDSLLLALPGSRRRQHFSALPYEELRRAVRNSGARRKVVILDCCYSGRAHANGHLDGSVPGEHREVAHQAPIEGACVLTATSDYARARASPDQPYTAFSGALISALENGVPGAGPHLDIRAVFGALRQEMRSQGLPRPHLSTRDDGSALVLGRNLAHDGDTVLSPPEESRAASPPPRSDLVRRRPRPAVLRRLAVGVSALAVVAATVTFVVAKHQDTPASAGACPAEGPRQADLVPAGRPDSRTRFPGATGFSLPNDLVGPMTVIGFEPPPADGGHPGTYLWQPERRCFAAPAGFGSDYLDVAVSPDGQWIAGVDMRNVPGAPVTVMDRKGGSRRVVPVPPGMYATHLQWNRRSDTLLFTQARADTRHDYTITRGADAVTLALHEAKPKVLELGANAPYQWGPDGTIAGNYGYADPLDVRMFDTSGRHKSTLEGVGILGQAGMKGFSPSEAEMVTHCPGGPDEHWACVWDVRRGDLVGTHPAGRVFPGRPFGSLGWYDDKHLLMTVWDVETDWWATAVRDIGTPGPGSAAGRTTVLGRMADKGGHLIFAPAPS
ncbi:caspase family protein [Streptomyces zhihengii]|uniref:caspase, EACC1-associated type n=1 Tax=Streptomyces zhihengii TaxID=1818004 RepID=UPI0036B2C16D